MTEPIELLGEQYLDVDRLWDSTLSFEVNVARIASGEARSGQPGLKHALATYVPAIDRSLRTPQERNAAGQLFSPADLRAHRQNIIAALRRPTSQTLQSPLSALQQQLTAIFQHGETRAGVIFVFLTAAAQLGSTNVRIPLFDAPVPWFHKAAVCLIGMLACPTQKLREVYELHSRYHNGWFTYEKTRERPSASLKSAFRDAKTRACGGEGKTSLIVVDLLDVHMLELKKQDRDEKYMNFSHAFVLGIGPEGVIMWQGWGQSGYGPYGLADWIRNGNSRVRDWQEAGDFVNEFEKFVSVQVSCLRIS